MDTADAGVADGAVELEAAGDDDDDDSRAATCEMRC